MQGSHSLQYNLNSNASCGEVLQGWEFGPALFNIFINDLEEGTHTTFVIAEDTTKLGGAVSSREDEEVTEKDLPLTDKWAGNTQLKSIPDTRQVKKEKNPSVSLLSRSEMLESWRMSGDDSWLGKNVQI